jgi:hypothetical protein
VDASILTIASRGAIGALETRAGLGVAGLSALLGSSRAYAPGVSLEALVREKDDNLAAALALGARTGRWVPLTGGADDAEPRDDGGDGAAAFTHVAPSSAAQAAMVVSAAEELGDGEAHPVTWKQIKTWFENRRMTQKRIKEGNARPPRRNSNAGTHVAGADESADARAAKKANDRGKPPRPPPSGKTRSSAKGGGVSSSKGASKHERGRRERSRRETRVFIRERHGRGPAGGAPIARRDALRRDGATRREARANGRERKAARSLGPSFAGDGPLGDGPLRRGGGGRRRRGGPTLARHVVGRADLRADPRDVVGGHTRRPRRRRARARALMKRLFFFSTNDVVRAGALLSLFVHNGSSFCT